MRTTEYLDRKIETASIKEVQKLQKAKLAAQYLYTGGPCGDRFGELIRKRHDEYAKLIRDANIKVQ